MVAPRAEGDLVEVDFFGFEVLAGELRGNLRRLGLGLMGAYLLVALRVVV